MSRIKYFDIFRGIGIILMVMGHIGFTGHFDYFIHAFHMPMFFFVAGYFFSNNIHLTFSNFLKKKSKAILLPYVSFGLIHYFIWLLANNDKMSFDPLRHLLWDNTDGLPIAGALWFLTAFFFSEVIFLFIRKIVNCKMQAAICLALAILGCYITKIMQFRLPWALDAAFVGVGFMALGFLLKNYIDIEMINRLLNLKFIKWLILALSTTILIFANGYINMRTGKYAIVPLFWINAILAMIVGLNMSKWIENFAPPFVRNILEYCGKNSIVFLCLNQLSILIVRNVINIFNLPTLIKAVIVFVLVMIILFILSYLILNTKLKLFIGK